MRITRLSARTHRQPKKAIGHERLIGPWLATLRPSRLFSFESRIGPSRLQDHSRGGSQSHRFARRSKQELHVQAGGAGCRDTCSQPWTAGEVFLLTSPLIGHSENRTSRDLASPRTWRQHADSQRIWRCATPCALKSSSGQREFSRVFSPSASVPGEKAHTCRWFRPTPTHACRVRSCPICTGIFETSADPVAAQHIHQTTLRPKCWSLR